MSGHLMDERFVAVYPSLVRLLGSCEAAIILQHLHWSADDTGDIKMPMAQIVEETGITLRTVERKVKWLRDEGYVVAHRSASYDATLTYRVDQSKVCGDQPAILADSRSRDPRPDPATLADSQPATLADSSTQKKEEPSGAVVGRAPDLAPEVHPQRPVPAGWTPSSEWISHLRVTYPDVHLPTSCIRFVNHHLARKDTTRSWEALFENWVSSDQQRINETKLAGTDDLGVPGTQRSTSVVGDALKPGDEGYFDPTAYLEQHPPGSD